MKNKNKKVLALGMSALMIFSASTLTGCSANKNQEKTDTTKSTFSDDALEPVTTKELTLDSESAKNILSDKYDENFVKRTYYVHSNDKRTILSQNESVAGYDLLGIYISRSASDAIIYMIKDNGDGTITYKALDYDELDKIPDRESLKLYVIDENSPEGLNGAFVPPISIDEIGYSKNYKK